SLLALGLAENVDRADSGIYASVSFTQRDLKELEYASLLHDFGKIGVREQVLVKAKKLHPHELDIVRFRIDYALKAAEAHYLARKLDVLGRGGKMGDLEAIELEFARRRQELEDAWRLIVQSNEPTVLKEGDFSRIAEVGRIEYVDSAGQSCPLLTLQEIESLQITRGSLNFTELEEIRSHVVHTFNFLSRIPWGKSFSRIPIIAGAHHERVDGTGYPNRSRAEEIPVPARVMAV